MTDPLFDLSGRVALVTGGSRGLGWQIALGFAAHGARVIVASRKQEACDRAAAEIRARHGVDAWAISANVSHWDQCDALVERAYQPAGRVDVLVNNAGLSPVYSSLTDVTEALYDKVLAVNLKGPFRLGTLIGERMAAAGSGAIINISSVEAESPSPRALPYAAAKAGLDALTIGLAAAYGPAVRVNTIMRRAVPHRHQQGLGPGRGHREPAAHGRAGPGRASRGDRGRGPVPRVAVRQFHVRRHHPGRRRPRRRAVKGLFR